ncbi:hypothetical protein C8R47DRAFT_590280 [Mycena vitilis]|nr:hypothetical protein C8R47DRAFT_590280 [Mycena vitilis]
MSYYHASPPSPTSSASSFSSGPPQTPTTPDLRRLSGGYPSSLVLPSLPDYADTFAQKPKQNTAERRASHNAVERARRETLNARFLDLAALLPNLKHLRRPSKSAIVNSSIAHVRAARRYRHLAAAQLRALNAECDAVRREVNAWRARANVHPAPTPLRSEGFALVLSGEEPAFDPVDLEGMGEDEEEGEVVRRRTQPAEGACEGPLVLSHPYAPKPASPFAPAPQQAYIPQPSPPHSHAASPVPPSMDPSTYDAFLLQSVPQAQHQHADADVWAFAAATHGTAGAW